MGSRYRRGVFDALMLDRIILNMGESAPIVGLRILPILRFGGRRVLQLREVADVSGTRIKVDLMKSALAFHHHTHAVSSVFWKRPQG
jgi:hypothetical protein